MAKKRKSKSAKKGTRDSARTKKSGPSKRASSRLLHASGEPTDETIVVYIHGIGPKPNPKTLKGEWDLALFGKDMKDRTRMAYWADILHDADMPLTQSIRRANASLNDEQAVSKILTDAGIDRDDEAARQYVEGLMLSVNAAVPAVNERGIRTKVVPLPRFLRDPLSRAFMQFFLKDSAAYFFDANVRQKIKQRLVDQLPSGGEPFILVSHSQGTVAAFEVLSEVEVADRAEATLLVTLGSPLGLQEVEDQLLDSKLELSVPPGVNNWHNFSDPLDPIALDHGLANEYAARNDVRVQDHLIINRTLRELTGINPHDAAGYLAHVEVRRVVHQAMRFDTAARFVVARDVAERFVARTMRQPVLIEVLEPRYWAVDESPADVAKREADQPAHLQTLAGRVTNLANEVRAVVKQHGGVSQEKNAVASASVQELRKYVAAHLTPSEIQELAERPREMHVYAMWRSAKKKKLLYRSHGPLSADAARHSYAADGRNIRWAVLDTGCRFDHPHFNAAGFGPTVEMVLDCTTNAPRPTPILDPKRADRDGHGTHVSGIIAGNGQEDGRSYFGVAPRAKLVVYKVLNDHGEGEDAWIIKAIDDILRRNENEPCTKIHGVNLSLGGPFDATVYGCGFSPICKELRDLWRQGVVVCVAAGNEGQIEVDTSDGAFDLNTLLSIGDPANLQDCVAVGSVNTDRPHIYGISYFSSRGPTADGRMKPDVVAPGERIVSCNSDFRPKGTGNKGPYREESGTSMACPHISGLIAAFLSVRPEFIDRPDEIKQILMANCNDLGRDRYHQGAGIPNLMKMLVNT